MMTGLCLPISMILLFSVPALASEINEMRLVDKEGMVYLQLAGTEDGELIEAIPGAPLEQGDHIITGPDGSARFVIESESIVELGPKTDFIIEKSNETGFQFFLSAGELFAKIRNLLENKKSMAIRTPVAVAAVRGTELAIAHDANSDKSEMAVFDEGKMSVTSTSTGEEADLIPGHEVTLVRGLGRPVPRPLQRFEGHRQRLHSLRERHNLIRKDWRPKTIEERSIFRKKLRQERQIRRNEPPRLDPKRELRREPRQNKRMNRDGR